MGQWGVPLPSAVPAGLSLVALLKSLSSIIDIFTLLSRWGSEKSLCLPRSPLDYQQMPRPYHPSTPSTETLPRSTKPMDPFSTTFPNTPFVQAFNLNDFPPLPPI